mgnify:CR=1 FL=1
MEIPGSGAQIQVPGAQHEAYVGEVEKSKKPENFREPKKCPPGTRESGFRAIFRPGADFSKNRRKKTHATHTPERSHGQQHKPWEPCACFPDYGRGQALTPSNDLEI